MFCSIWRVWEIRSGSLSLWSSKWTVVCAKWPTPHCSANLLELGSKMHLRTPWGLWLGWFIIAKYCTSMDFKPFLGETDFLRPFCMTQNWQPDFNLKTYWWYFIFYFWLWTFHMYFYSFWHYRVDWCVHPTLPALQKVQDLQWGASQNRITERIKSHVNSCALTLNDCSSPWWIYWEGESCFYSQMNLFRTLMGAIKNDIFIFRLGGLTRTATVSYYSTQDGGFSGDLASLYNMVAMPCCTTSAWTVL